MRSILAAAAILATLAAPAAAQTCADVMTGPSGGGFGCDWSFEPTSSTRGTFALDSNSNDSFNGCLTFEQGQTTSSLPAPKFNVWVDFKVVYGCTCRATGPVASPNFDAGVFFECVKYTTQPTQPGANNFAGSIVGRVVPNGNVKATMAFEDGTSGKALCVPDRFCKP
jgi:hypothetical protein